jgi:DNA-binding NtrC family response regulator
MTSPAIRHDRSAPRLVLCACDRSTASTLRAALIPPEFELHCCPAVESVIEEVVRRRPEVVVYELRAQCPSDLAVLQLLKRVAPEVPLVLIACAGSLNQERVVRELRPVYYAVQPAEPEEILDAVHAALGRRARHTA